MQRLTWIRKKTVAIAVIILQIAVLYGLADLGGLISKLLHTPVPGSIFGLIILFLLLQFRVLRLDWIARGGDLLIREMLLFFVPSSVGIMTYGHLMLHEGLQILVTIVCSTAIVMLITGTMADNIWKARQLRRPRRTAHEDAKEVASW
ncbi:holin-like protein CidA [Alicyclobacillus hesperidum]|uniref:Holin-like protein n=1 Tax=Alicyclobacillus hesperidum TaxID=89784 RepID=A0A1H2S3K5_9BACL|nr:CidA/LrgA family protein [Alicyclobacillus hesperidum]GLV13357.1 holin-like protein CidA [Alicyclobacillus hesperidum]SDW26090.1 holin-like protein [Alicyclobacillus hesperidum]